LKEEAMRRLDVVSFALIGLAELSGCGRGGGDDTAAIAAPLTISLRSDAFTDGTAIPKKNGCDAENVSPHLAWSGVSPEAKSLALICDDPDAPMGTWTHWLLFNLPADLMELKPGMPAAETVTVKAKAGGAVEAMQGKNDFGKLGYGGPCPPSGTHHYHFRLYALDGALNLKPGAKRAELLGAMKGHVLGQGRLMGTYSR
jgi:Raf kinase inhibitor-like YbhB/YbcL family protein